MCGICGIFERSGHPINPLLLQKMISALRHRGPDGTGELINQGIGLGHRRLSIIDVAGGAQPMSTEDGRLQLVFNGEIYNFIELRQELAASGYIFKTHSDTEVILHAYQHWGKQCVQHFNGMFAFALCDFTHHEIFLARDHLGIKPLYYVDLQDRFLFASEIKSLLQEKTCPREIDLEALAELFTFRYVPSPKTLFKGIMKLPPGHTLTLSAKGIEITRFWNSIPCPIEKYDENSLIEEYQALLTDAVRLQLRSDVPLGLFLSSGIDSGALLAIMSQYSSSPIQTFTIGFAGGEKTNELEGARSLAEMFGADHHTLTVGPEDYLKYFENYLWDLEEPLGNETAAAFYFVSKIASQQVKVALCGQGADELWAGYDRHRGAQLSTYYSQMPKPLTNSLVSLMARIPGRFERLKRGVLSLAEPDLLTRFAKIYSFFNAEMQQQLFIGPLKDQIGNDEYQAKEALRHLQSEVRCLDPVTQLLYIDVRTNLPDDLLMAADKMSMVNSLEVRVPFLDYRLVEFAESLPCHLKIKGLTGKYLHKKTLQKWLPKTVIYRKKKGFSNPIEHWLRTKKIRSLIEEYLLEPDSGTALYFDQNYIRHLLKLDYEGKDQLRRHIYLLISFELWYRTFIKI
ncbi:MAG: asparagine synthase (glutamine-hydrolyzing) [Candidatus Competibacter denitrificans]